MKNCKILQLFFATSLMMMMMMTIKICGSTCDVTNLRSCLVKEATDLKGAEMCRTMWTTTWLSQDCDACSACLGNVTTATMVCAYGLPYWDCFICTRGGQGNATACPCPAGQASQCISSAYRACLSCADQACILSCELEILECIVMKEQQQQQQQESSPPSSSSIGQLLSVRGKTLPALSKSVRRNGRGL